jgi:hypothetical protein
VTRDDGLLRADISTALFSDPKIRALWRLTGDEARMNRAATVYLATVLDSWAAGRRIPADEAAPFWMSDTDEARADLARVHLLDDAGMIPEHAWQSWFGPAAQRTADARLRSMIGGLMRSLGLTKDEATVEARRRLAQPSYDLAETQAAPNPTNQPGRPGQPGQPGDDSPGSPLDLTAVRLNWGHNGGLTPEKKPNTPDRPPAPRTSVEPLPLPPFMGGPVP